jgi:hypothetical protein
MYYRSPVRAGKSPPIFISLLLQDCQWAAELGYFIADKITRQATHPWMMSFHLTAVILWEKNSKHTWQTSFIPAVSLHD